MGHHLDLRLHVGVVHTAQFSAPNIEISEFIRGDPGVGDCTGVGIDLDPKFNNPKTVNHVDGSHIEVDRCINGNNEDITGDLALVWILKCPDPLLPGDIYVNRFGGIGLLIRRDRAI